MARMSEAIIDTVVQNLDDEIWDRELSDGIEIPSELLALARSVAPQAADHELARAARALAVSGFTSEDYDADDEPDHSLPHSGCACGDPFCDGCEE
jgi:hypothetical protein